MRHEPAGAETTIGDVLPAAIATAIEELPDPRQQKERLKARFRRACGTLDPLDEWTAGAAANLVVYHDVPIELIDQILCDLDAMRRVGSLRSPARFFHGQVRKLAHRLGKPWPRKRGD